MPVAARGSAAGKDAAADGDGGRGGPSLDEVQGLMDLDEIRGCLADLTAGQQDIEEELDVLLRGEEDLRARMLSLQGVVPKLEIVQMEGSQLATRIQSTSSLAESISSKVRELDMAQSNLHQTLKKVKDVADLKDCIEGVQTAMASEDFETAASYVQRYLSFDSSILDQGSNQLLQTASDRLKDVVRQKCDEAARTDDQATVLRFCRLFAPLGLEEEGLRRYCQYLRAIVARKANDDFAILAQAVRDSKEEGMSGDSAQTLHLDAVTRLVELVVGLLDDHESVIEKQFGPPGILSVLASLQMQTDTQALKLLDRFEADWKISKAVRDVRNGGSKDPRELDLLLHEIGLVSQRCELFDQFMRHREREALKAVRALEQQLAEAAVGGEAPPKMSFDSLQRTSRLNERMQELMGGFVTLEEYFMVQNVAKAIRNDEPYEDDAEALTSSVVEDVFYILQRCSDRAMLTGSASSVCAIINHINTTINQDFKDYHQKGLRESSSNMFALSAKNMEKLRAGKENINKLFAAGSEPMSPPPGGGERKKTSHLMLLNNLDVAAEYTTKLKQSIEAECQATFSDTQMGMIQQMLSDLLDTSRALKNASAAGLEQMFANIQPRMKPVIDVFGSLSYDLTEAGFAEFEVNDPYAKKLVLVMAEELEPFKTQLTGTNLDALCNLMISHVTKRMEQLVFQKAFNQLGAIQLDNDLRCLLSFFSEVSSRTARDKFMRLNQIANILNFESVQEMRECWGDNSGAITWRLTPAEARQVLKLRVEFSKEAIAQLKL